MQVAMRLALQDAGLDATVIDYVSAHGTATELGDICRESCYSGGARQQDTDQFDEKAIPVIRWVPAARLKPGLPVHMMNEGWFHPTANLENIDPACAELDTSKAIFAKWIANI